MGILMTQLATARALGCILDSTQQPVHPGYLRSVVSHATKSKYWHPHTGYFSSQWGSFWLTHEYACLISGASQTPSPSTGLAQAFQNLSEIWGGGLEYCPRVNYVVNIKIRWNACWKAETSCYILIWNAGSWENYHRSYKQLKTPQNC